MERWKAEFTQLLFKPQALLLDSRYFSVVGVLLILVDAVVTTGIMWKVPCELTMSTVHSVRTFDKASMLEKWNICASVLCRH